jgi:hypothetical protein
VSSRALVAAGAVVVVLALAGAAVLAVALLGESKDAEREDTSAAIVPADALLYVSALVDEDSGQW